MCDLSLKFCFFVFADDKEDASQTEDQSVAMDGNSEASVFSTHQSEPSDFQSSAQLALQCDSQPTLAETVVTTMAGVPLPPNLAASLDPQQLKIEPALPGKGGKITKESFDRPPSTGLSSRGQDPADPLSSLDPLWTMKKPEN